MSISFPAQAVWGDDRDVVYFPAEVDGKRIRCAITLEALQDNFDGDSTEPVACFRANRARIEAKAAKLIAQARFEPDGQILIRSQDGA